jgi:hypothetical protein
MPTQNKLGHSPILELAKQGNLAAITALLNRSLQAKGVQAKVVLQERCLKVMLEAANIPDQQIFASYVFRGISSLSIPSVDTLQVYGRPVGEKKPSWTEAFHLEQTSSSIDVTSSVTSAVSNPIDRADDLDKITPVEQSNTALADPYGANLTKIETILNQVMHDQSITIQVEMRDELLKITAKTDQMLDSQIFTQLIQQELKNIDLTGFKTISLYKQKMKGSYEFKIKSFSVFELEEHTSAIETSLPDTINTSINTSINTNQNSAPVVSGISRQQRLQPKPQSKLNIRRLMTIGVSGTIAFFVVITMIRRLFIVLAFSPAFGYFSVILGFAVLWRAWSILNPLLQTLLRSD